MLMHELGLFVTKLEGVYNVDDLENLKIHLQKVCALKMSTKIGLLHKNHKPFVTKSPITIALQNTWEGKELRLVEVFIANNVLS